MAADVREKVDRREHTVGDQHDVTIRKPAVNLEGRCHRRGCIDRSPHVEDLAMPKSLKSGNFTLAKAVNWRMPVNEISNG
jgi:hypothetical protein